MTPASHLIVAETFYSIQGEGRFAGTPAVFLRLAGCNLRCNGFSYVDPQTGEHLGCDSKHVWRNGEKMAFHSLFNHWEEKGWLTALKQGAHLVITGGEPVIQQNPLIPFIDALEQRLQSSPFIEIETNATLLFSPLLFERINQINASPKLNSSGESREKAYHPAVLKQLSHHPNISFKFVIQTPDDITEVIDVFLKPFHLSPQQMWLMPEGGTQTALAEKSAWIVEACKQHHFHFSPRLQITIWGEVTGV